VAANLAWLVAECVVEPYYVAAGFSLYLARRSELEGWDIEVAFRRLSRRLLVEHAAPALRLLAAAALGLLLAGGAPQSGWAEQAPERVAATPPGNAEDARKAIRKVLEDPVFGHSVADTEWQRRHKATPGQVAPGWLRLLEEFGKMIAGLMQGAVYVLGAALLLYIGILLYRRRHDWLGSPRSAALPESLFGLDVRPESLPADPGAAARALLAAGDVVGSLSLLYRGALSVLLHRRHIDFRQGDTEADCLKRARGRIEQDAHGYFSHLLDAWKLAAYAHQPPPAEHIGSLCDDWARHFGARA
jgi:hypothetical protein